MYSFQARTEAFGRGGGDIFFFKLAYYIDDNVLLDIIIKNAQGRKRIVPLYSPRLSFQFFVFLPPSFIYTR